jgi:hypothetical protein
MAGLDPAIDAEFTLVEALYGPLGQGPGVMQEQTARDPGSALCAVQDDRFAVTLSLAD